ncbi:uncharacterized protein ACBT57_015164 isoform 1-T1 [Dama dama]
MGTIGTPVESASLRQGARKRGLKEACKLEESRRTLTHGMNKMEDVNKNLFMEPLHGHTHAPVQTLLLSGHITSQLYLADALLTELHRREATAIRSTTMKPCLPLLEKACTVMKTQHSQKKKKKKLIN